MKRCAPHVMLPPWAWATIRAWPRLIWVALLILTVLALLPSPTGASIDTALSDNVQDTALTVSRASVPLPPLLLVTTLDGRLHGVDVATGRTLWATDTGVMGQSVASGESPAADRQPSPSSALLRSNFIDDRKRIAKDQGNAAGGSGDGAQDGTHDDSHSTHDDNLLYLVDPTQPGGHVYATMPGEPIRKLPYSIKDLVALSPFRSAGRVYIGHKTTVMLDLDVRNGRLVRRYAMNGGAGGDGHSAIGEHRRREHIVSVGYVEYELSVFAEDDLRRPRWNVTFAEYAPALWTSGSTPPNTRPIVYADHFVGGVDGTLMRFVDRDSLSWSHAFASPVAHVYRVLQRVVEVEADSGIDTGIKSSAIEAMLVEETLRAPRGTGPAGSNVFVHVGLHQHGGFYLLHSDRYVMDRGQASFPNVIVPYHSTSSNDGDDAHQPPRELTANSCHTGSPTFPQCLLGTHRHGTRNEDQQELIAWQDWQQMLLDSALDYGRKRPPLLLLGEGDGGDTGFIISQTLAMALAVVFVTTIVLLWRMRGSSRDPPARPSSSLAGKIQVSSAVLGHGSHGTVVFAGTFDGRDVAVKRLLVEFYDVADHEVSLLRDTDFHPNVVRYFCRERHGPFLYIALERCVASLADIIECEDPSTSSSSVTANAEADLSPTMSNLLWEIRQRLLADPTIIMAEIAAGVAHLHSLNIVHRDLKPQNILIKQVQGSVGIGISSDGKYRAVAAVSDFGLSKRLTEEQSSFMHTTHHHGGTIGWRAPESIREVVGGLGSGQSHSMSPSSTSVTGLDAGLSTTSSTVLSTSSNVASPSSTSSAASTSSTANPLRITKALDIFSLGLVFHYILTAGDHPFGDRFSRERNILADEPDLSALLTVSHEAHDLVSRMLRRQPSERPSANDIPRHPFFWSASRRLAFLQDASDRLDAIDKLSPLIQEFELCGSEVMGAEGWQHRVHRGLYENMGKYRKYDTMRFRDLLRAIRNKKNHYQDLPPFLQRLVGPLPDGFLSYFTRKFPCMLMTIYNFIANTPLLHTDPLLRQYYDTMA